MSNQLIYTGKAKDIYSTEDENVIKSVYKDQATMLNGARKENIKGKGVLNNQISSLIFEKEPAVTLRSTTSKGMIVTFLLSCSVSEIRSIK